jgi:hypothetical protein
MDERQDMVEYLTEKVGTSLEETELMIRDSDLWLLEPEQRYVLDGEEAVEVWQTAVLKLEALADVAYQADVFGNVGVSQLMADNVARAKEMLRRARERVGDE